MKKTFRIGGIHPDDNKISRNCKIEALPLPQTVYISMAQHLGAPAKPIVAVGDKVKAGQPIAEPGGFISAWVHSSVSGTVKSIAPRKDISGNIGSIKSFCNSLDKGSLFNTFLCLNPNGSIIYF